MVKNHARDSQKTCQKGAISQEKLEHIFINMRHIKKMLQNGKKHQETHGNFSGIFL